MQSIHTVGVLRRVRCRLLVQRLAWLGGRRGRFPRLLGAHCDCRPAVLEPGIALEGDCVRRAMA